MKSKDHESFQQKLHNMYDEIEMEYRPEVRWWLAEGFHIDETLIKNIREIHDSGFGAAEFLAMPETGADSSVYGWGSEEWTNDTMQIIKKATELGLGFSVTSGTNWANANLPDTYVYDGEPYNPDNKAASQVLDYATICLGAGEKFSGELPKVKISGGDEERDELNDMHGSNGAATKQVFQGVVAARIIKVREGAGVDGDEGIGTGVLEFSSLTDITEKVAEKDGIYTLEWTAPMDGEYAVFVYWMHGSCQTADPSVSINYTVNYVDTYGIEALIQYWEDVILTEEMREAIRMNGRGEIYMDSLELRTEGAGGILWGYSFKEEFMKRKRYDITPYLPVVTEAVSATRTTANPVEYDYTVDSEKDLKSVEKIRNDFYDVSSQLYNENVLKPLRTWLHTLGMQLRAEPSYGMYYEISTPAQNLDDVETESFAQNADIDLFRGLLGSANLYGVKLSSETGAIWFNDKPSNYTRTMDEWTELCKLQFVNGVSRTVFHGYSAIEGAEGTQWPGHEGMYAYCTERWNSRQPAFKDFKDFNEMLARNQKVLNQGTPSRDIAVLRTDYAFFNYGYAEGHDTPYYNNQMYDIPYHFNDQTLQQAGYTYDYFSPQLLTDEEHVKWTASALQPDGPAYKAIIVYQETMELASAVKLLEIAKAGLPIVFVNNNDETVTLTGPKYHNGEAATRSKFYSDKDEDVKAITDQIKALPNVKTVDSPAKTLEALKTLGVEPRVAFTESNNRILTISRNDWENNLYYVYAYSYKATVHKGEEPYTFVLKIEGEGVPYEINDWTGEITKSGCYEIKEGYTYVTKTLIPGESVIIVLNLSEQEDEKHAISTTAKEVKIEDSVLHIIVEETGTCETLLNNGEIITLSAVVPEKIKLEKFDITIEDWNAGEKKVNREEKFGHVTEEIYFETVKRQLTFKNCEPVPWKELPASEEQLAMLGYEGAQMKDISGIGIYETTFVIPESWNAQNGAYLKMENANGGSVAVYVNDEKTSGVDTRTLSVDISRHLRIGENRIRIEVASTLYNRCVQREYYGFLGEGGKNLEAADYGLTGEVTIVPYTILAF